MTNGTVRPTDAQLQAAAGMLGPVLHLTVDEAIRVAAVALRFLFDATDGRYDERKHLTVLRALREHAARVAYEAGRP